MRAARVDSRKVTRGAETVQSLQQSSIDAHRHYRRRPFWAGRSIGVDHGHRHIRAAEQPGADLNAAGAIDLVTPMPDGR
jgi:hypothetical protein